MKKIRKINLELNKEVISSLSNEDMNQMKGGLTSTVKDTMIMDKDRGCQVCKVDPVPYTETTRCDGCLIQITDDCPSFGCPLSWTCQAVL